MHLPLPDHLQLVTACGLPHGPQTGWEETTAGSASRHVAVCFCPIPPLLSLSCLSAGRPANPFGRCCDSVGSKSLGVRTLSRRGLE